jgi:hypothetical protein
MGWQPLVADRVVRPAPGPRGPARDHGFCRAAGRPLLGGPIQFTGPLAICINCLVIVALVANPYTAGGALLFYGVTLLVAAWRGQPGCEATVLSNLILRRDDQIGCPTFSPIDAAEARRAARSADRGPAITATGAWRGGR